MTMSDNGDPEADAPNAGNNAGRDPRQDAGQDRSISKRLAKNPASEQAQLDSALDETMDGSDPVGIIQPQQSSEPPASSGYDPDAERSRADEKR